MGGKWGRGLEMREVEGKGGWVSEMGEVGRKWEREMEIGEGGKGDGEGSKRMGKKMGEGWKMGEGGGE